MKEKGPEERERLAFSEAGNTPLTVTGEKGERSVQRHLRGFSQEYPCQ